MTTPALHDPPTRLPRAALAGGFVGFFVSGGLVSLYGPAAPAFRRVFEVGTFVSGLPAAVHPALAFVGVLLWAWLASRIPPGRLLVVGAIAIAVSAAGVAWAPSMAMVLVGVVGVGAGFGILANGMNTIYPRDTRPRTPAVVGTMHGVFGAGAVLLPLLLSTAGYRLAFALLAVLAITAIPLMRTTVAPPDAATTAPTAVGTRAPLVAFGALFAIYVGTEAATAAWFATYLESLGWSEAAGARWTSGFWFVFAGGRFVFAPLMLRMAPGRLIPAVLPAATVLLGLALVPPIAPYAVLGAALCLSAVFPTAMVWLPRVLPSAPNGTTVAVLAAMTGATVAPLLVGAAGSWIAPSAIPVTWAALAALAAGAAVAVRRHVGAG